MLLQTEVAAQHGLMSVGDCPLVQLTTLTLHLMLPAEIEPRGFRASRSGADSFNQGART